MNAGLDHGIEIGLIIAALTRLIYPFLLRLLTNLAVYAAEKAGQAIVADYMRKHFLKKKHHE